MIKILCPEPDSFSQKGLKYASTFANLTATTLTQNEFKKIAVNYDALLIRFNTKVTNSFFQKNSKIKAIISPTTGLDHIDMGAARINGVKVYHLRGETSFLKDISGTSELAIGLMLSVMRKIPQSFDSVKDGQWSASSFRGNEVSGKILGVIGCGRLGTKVCKSAIALGMNVISYDPFISKFPEGVKSKKNQLELLTEADIISLHVPLLPETRHLIGEKEINSMKTGVIIINTSRGAIIETKSLVKNLENSKIYSAAVDVMEDEHLFLAKNHPLVRYASKRDNLIITPHIGGATYESVEKTDLFILKKYEEELTKKL